jgi:hypothetical protein
VDHQVLIRIFENDVSLEVISSKGDQVMRKPTIESNHRVLWAFGKAASVGILLAPLALMLFSGLNHRPGNTASGVAQGGNASRADVERSSSSELPHGPKISLSAEKSER